jgi:hypothetical protein
MARHAGREGFSFAEMQESPPALLVVVLSGHCSYSFEAAVSAATPVDMAHSAGGDKMARAFVAFQMEDRWARDFLVQHAKDKNNNIGFTDYSVHQPFDEKWKTNCKERISKTKGTIVMIGPETSKAEAVLWEIAETNRQQHPIFGVQINHDKTHTIPPGLPSSRVVRWDFDAIVKSWNGGGRPDRAGSRL